MANETIAQLPAAGPLGGTEPVPMVQGGVTVRTTAQAIAALANSGLAASTLVALPAAGPLSGTEIVPVVQTGVTVRTTAQAIASYALSPVQIAGLPGAIAAVGTLIPSVTAGITGNVTAAGIAALATITSSAINNLSPGSILTSTLIPSTTGGAVGSVTAAQVAATVTRASYMLTTVQVLGPPAVSFAPTANPPVTLGSLVVQGTTDPSLSRQFLGSFGLTSNSGHGTPGADKVALYAAVNATSGSSDVWALNTVTGLNPGLASDVNAFGYELDFNNLVADRGNASVAAPAFWGLGVTGAGTFKSTGAILVSGPGGTKIWNRGIVFANNCVNINTIEDDTSSTTSYLMTGVHTTGIDMSAASLTTAIALPNNAPVSWLNGAGNATITDFVSSANNRHVGHGAANAIVEAPLLPLTDNSVSCGGPSNRWTAVYATNGTIQTSDPALKRDVQDVPSGMLALVNSVSPVTFKWRDGGGGKPGKRTHWGFLAPEIKAAFESIGRDFGGYVESEGVSSLRPDQLIPVLWAAVIELSAEVRALREHRKQ